MAALLDIKNLHAFYGKSHVLHGVDLHVDEGEIVSLLGRNGVGRSTTVKSAMGQVSIEGSIQFKGEEIRGLKAFEIAHQRDHHGWLRHRREQHCRGRQLSQEKHCYSAQFHHHGNAGKSSAHAKQFRTKLAERVPVLP